MNTIPQCPKDLPENIAQTIRQLGKQWKLTAINPKINPETVRKWDNLVDAWLSATDIPIIVRKRSSGLRGRAIEHTTGRKIIISDNSPAQWVCHHALLDDVPTIDKIRDFLKNDELPIAIVLKTVEKDAADYKCQLKKSSINEYGWKLCHIEKVGLNTKEDISRIPIEELNDKFLKLMKPSNFFLLPKEWGGLGESKEFIDEMRK